MTLSVYDAVMAGLVLSGMVWGAWKGLTWQIASLASLIVGYASSHHVSGRIVPYLPGDPLVARAASMLVAYVIVSGLIFAAAWLIRTTLRRIRLEAYDRHLGMVAGGLVGALLGVVGTMFVVSLVPDSREAVFSSTSGHLVRGALESVGPALPSEVRTALVTYFENGVAGIADQKVEAVRAPRDTKGEARSPEVANPGDGKWWGSFATNSNRDARNSFSGGGDDREIAGRTTGDELRVSVGDDARRTGRDRSVERADTRQGRSGIRERR